MSQLPHEAAFVLDTPPLTAERIAGGDLYPPDGDTTVPAIVFVHGMPFPSEWAPPSRWPVYTGYGRLAAAHGCAGAVIDHGDGAPDYETSTQRLAAALRAVREHPRVDTDRVALWFFSGGGLLSADHLRTPPDWLRCVALTYPMLDHLRDFPVPDRLRPIDAVAADSPPLVLTRCGREDPALNDAVERFTAAAAHAGADLTVVDTPDGRHGFDFLDHTEQSRTAVTEALTAVIARLNRD